MALLKPGQLVKHMDFMTRRNLWSNNPGDTMDYGLWDPSHESPSFDKMLLVMSCGEKEAVYGKLWQTQFMSDGKLWTFWSRSQPDEYFEVVQDI